ncbi:MAG: hypothetical protein LWW77_11555, partial [Propionibacteriales bacterium]|nr:hypothetical protein [Propionibacteriales bacterium]
KVMSEAYVLPDEIPSKRLARYMEGFLALIIAASSMFSVIRADPEALQMRKQMWADLYAKDVKMAKRLGRHPLVLGSNLSSPTGRKISVGLYRLAQRIYRFS